MPARAALLQLADDLRQELGAIDRTIAEAARCTSDLAERPPSYLELRGAGDIVHDFYNGVERFLERVSVEMNGALPAGPDSHARLLDRMARELPDVRPAVLRPEVRTRLEEYLRFRHLFRHRYGYELRWDKLLPLLRGLAELAPDLHHDLESFVRATTELASRLD